VVRHRVLTGIGVVVALVVAACADDDPRERAEPAASTAAAGTDAPASTSGGDLDGVAAADGGACPDPPELAATEIGVTSEVIRFAVYAPVDNPFAPGLADGNRDGVYIWRDWLAERCGLAGRTVEIEFFDTHLDTTGTEWRAAQAAACDRVLAFVGGFELFDGDVDTMATCPDQTGAPTGLPDLGVVFGEPAHQLNPTSYATIPPASLSALQDVGGFQEVVRLAGGSVRGVWLVPNDLPSVRQLQIDAFDARLTVPGVEQVARFEVGGREEDYDPFTQALIDGGADYAESGLAVESTVRWRQNVVQLAPDAAITWGDGSSSYDPALFAAGGDLVEGTYVWIQTLPFEERDVNTLLDDYLRIAEEHGYAVDGLGLQAFIAGIAMTDVVERIVAERGPDGITRAAVLDGLAALRSYDARGLFGPTDIGARRPSGCFVLLQARDGAFARVHPPERGTLDCGADNLVAVGAPLARDAPGG
jgi:hypothetical protein